MGCMVWKGFPLLLFDELWKINVYGQTCLLIFCQIIDRAKKCPVSLNFLQNGGEVLAVIVTKHTKRRSGSENQIMRYFCYFGAHPIAHIPFMGEFVLCSAAAGLYWLVTLVAFAGKWQTASFISLNGYWNDIIAWIRKIRQCLYLFFRNTK